MNEEEDETRATKPEKIVAKLNHRAALDHISSL